MDNLLTNLGVLSEKVTEALKADLDEQKIRGRYNKMSQIVTFKEFMEEVLKPIYWLYKHEGGGIPRIIREFSSLIQGLSIHGRLWESSF